MQATITKKYLISKGCSSWGSLHLNDKACKPHITSEHVTFLIPYNGCGTRRESNRRTNTFSNAVSSSEGGVRRKTKPQFLFTCEMDTRSKEEVTHHVDEFESTEDSQKQNGQFQVQFLFFDSPTFLHPLNNMPYFASLNQDLLIKATLHSYNKNLVLFIDTCVASPIVNDFESESHVLIKKGCIQDTKAVSLLSQNGKVSQIKFKPFQFAHRPNAKIYLQCKMVVCRKNDYASRCYQGCQSRSKREEMREETSTGQEHVQVLGPFQLK
ncbi:deleted in malignant brain tumors 1 protein-like [Hemicordylus capensis]|uniref:deleted in malignant brain tumors 1 protein-like n=1 Tax=Hemicordylus capensis TaxID=884348 RepID=UPI002303764D|nr:deleted in malignant brain tumors 1 protein-like [Hemicordylus capensis]